MTGTILYNATVLTMDEYRPQASAVLLRKGRIESVGDGEVLSQRDDRTHMVDLGGRTVCPGFIDAHHHLGLAAWYERGIDLSICNSKSDVLLLLEWASQHCGEQWLYAYNYAPRRFEFSVRLTRHDLDGAVGDQPTIVMDFSFHEGVVSSAGLYVAGIDRHTPDPFGGKIVRDSRNQPTGELLETAIGPVEALARQSAAGTGYDSWVAALERYCSGLLASGITHVCDPGVDSMLQDYLLRAGREGRLPVGLSMYLASKSGLFIPPVDRIRESVEDSNHSGIEIKGLKLFADGGTRCAVCTGLRESIHGVFALVGRAAKLRRPALMLASRPPDKPHFGRDSVIRMGYLHYDQNDLTRICRDADEVGLGLAIHAACNDGIESTLHALESLEATRRPRVEHLVSLDRKQMRRLADLGAIGVVQPMYVNRMGDEWEALPTPPRLRSIPLRDLKDAGVTLAGSSDAPVAAYNPLWGMATAVDRLTEGGLTHQPEQAITPLEALQMWTTGSATAVGRSGDLGVIRPGACADLVVLSHNPLTISPQNLATIRVEQTFVGGELVYSLADGSKSDDSG